MNFLKILAAESVNQPINPNTEYKITIKSPAVFIILMVAVALALILLIIFLGISLSENKSLEKKITELDETNKKINDELELFKSNSSQDDLYSNEFKKLNTADKKSILTMIKSLNSKNNE